MKRFIASITIAVCVVAMTAAPAGAKSPKRSCIKALTAAEQVTAITVEFVDAVSTFFRRASVAAEQGDVSSFIADITNATTDLGERTRDLTADLDPVVDRYNRAATKCRAGR